VRGWTNVVIPGYLLDDNQPVVAGGCLPCLTQMMPQQPRKEIFIHSSWRARVHGSDKSYSLNPADE